jgi:hypothetical protein
MKKDRQDFGSYQSKMAGVAGFEPTNDGVRGCTKLLKMAKN